MCLIRVFGLKRSVLLKEVKSQGKERKTCRLHSILPICPKHIRNECQDEETLSTNFHL